MCIFLYFKVWLNLINFFVITLLVLIFALKKQVISRIMREICPAF